jgi:predicted dehydrogenase
MKTTRRIFLGRSLAGAASLAASACTGLSPSPRRRVDPNDRLRIAVVGLRGRGAAHVTYWLRMSDVEVAALCDVDPSVAAGPMKEVEGATGRRPAFVQDLRRILDDPRIDAISVATPNHWHVLASFWAVEAGKDVYVEKPMSHNVWEGRRLVSEARRLRRVVQNGTQSRSRENVREAIAFLHGGSLGPVRTATGLCYKDRRSIGKKPDGPVPKSVDYDLWLGPAPVRPFNPNRFHYEWHWNWDYGNGDIGNQGAHQMDVARWGLGKDSLPTRVASLGGRFGYEDDGETPNTQVAVLDWPDARLVFEVRGLPTESYRNNTIGVVFHCEKGSVVVGNLDTAAFDPDGAEIRRFSGGSDLDHFRNFVEAAKARDPSLLTSDALEGHLSAALSHLANVSYQLGTVQPLKQDDPFGDCPEGNEAFVRMREHLARNGVDPAGAQVRVGRSLAFDPKLERFLGDEGANALLSRDYRAPFVVPSEA